MNPVRNARNQQNRDKLAAKISNPVRKFLIFDKASGTKRWLALINVLILIFFILDRILKKIALDGATKKIFFLKFSQFQNPNIALSIPLKGFIFYFLLVIILGCVVSGLIKSYQSDRLSRISGFSLILTGALSNLLDRLKFGVVIDYFAWPAFTIFNLADLMILGGVFILAWQILFGAKTS